MLRASILRIAFGVALTAAGASGASSAVVTSLSGASPITIPVVAGNDDTAGSAGPVTFGPGITYTSTTSNSVFGYTGTYGFSPTVQWSGTPMIGLNVGTGRITLLFASPVSGFLAETDSTEFASSSDALVMAYDAAGRQLDRIVLEHNGHQVQPGFLGFSYASDLISRVTFSGEYIGFRSASFTQADAAMAIPEPGSLALVLAGTGFSMACLRRGTQKCRTQGPCHHPP